MPLNASNLFQYINKWNKWNEKKLSFSFGLKQQMKHKPTSHPFFHWQWLCGQPCLVRLKGWDLRVKRCVYLHTVCMICRSCETEAFACTEDQVSVSQETIFCCLSTSQTGVFNLTTSTCPVHMSATDASNVFITSLTSPFRAVSKHQRLISLSSSSINQPEPCTAYEDVKKFNLNINELKIGTVNCRKSFRTKR